MTSLRTFFAYAAEQNLYITMRTSLPNVFIKNALIIATDSVSDVLLFAYAVKEQVLTLPSKLS